MTFEIKPNRIDTEAEIVAIVNENVSDATPETKGLVYGTTTTAFNGDTSNTSIGHFALPNNVSGINNSAFGVASLIFNTTGSDNTAIGLAALRVNSTGSSNTAIGYYALSGNTVGTNNTAVGRNALNRNFGGNSNVSIGDNSLYYVEGGVQNTAIGVNSGYNHQVGTNNTFLGFNAGYNFTQGNNNIFIGASSDGSATSMSNQITLGNSSVNRFRVPGLGIDWYSDTAPGKIDSATISSNTQTTVSSVALIGFTTVEYTISIKQGSKMRSSRLLAHIEGTSVDSVEYSILETGGSMSGVNVTALESASSLILAVTITDASSTNALVKVAKTVIN